MFLRLAVATFQLCIGASAAAPERVDALEISERLSPSHLVLSGATLHYTLRLRCGETGRMVADKSLSNRLGVFAVLRASEFRGVWREGARGGDEVGFDFELRATNAGFQEVPWPLGPLVMPGAPIGAVFAVPPRPRVLVVPHRALSAAVALVGVLLVLWMAARQRHARERRRLAEEEESNEKRERLRSIKGRESHGQ